MRAIGAVRHAICGAVCCLAGTEFCHRGSTPVRYPSCVSVNEFTRITFDLLPFVARITLQNPPINVIDIPMMEEVFRAISLAEARPDVSVLVLAGSEKAFSAGVDVAAHTPDKVAEMLSKFHAIFRALVASRKVLVAGVCGHCLGGGAELAMMCDVVITSETATWGFPEISLGCYPPVATTALASVVGQKPSRGTYPDGTQDQWAGSIVDGTGQFRSRRCGSSG